MVERRSGRTRAGACSTGTTRTCSSMPVPSAPSAPLPHTRCSKTPSSHTHRGAGDWRLLWCTVPQDGRARLGARVHGADGRGSRPHHQVRRPPHRHRPHVQQANTLPGAPPARARRADLDAGAAQTHRHSIQANAVFRQRARQHPRREQGAASTRLGLPNPAQIGVTCIHTPSGMRDDKFFLEGLREYTAHVRKPRA